MVDAPRPRVDHVEGFLVLDFDGVLNSLNQEVDRSSLPTVAGSTGRPLPINMVDDEILDALQSALRPGVRVAWLTSWGSLISRVEELLGGRLRGGFVVAERPTGFYVPADWKYEAFLTLRAQWPNARTAWSDDDAVPMAIRYNSSAGLSDALLVAPNPEVGLTLQDARQMAEHLSSGRGIPAAPASQRN